MIKRILCAFPLIIATSMALSCARLSGAGMQYPLHTAAASATCTSGATYCIAQDQTNATGHVIGRSSPAQEA